MPSRPRRAGHAVERLDSPVHDPRTLRRSLAQITQVNRWLGGRRALLARLEPLLPPGDARVLDVGTGSGDLPRDLLARGGRPGRRLSVIALDVHPQMLEAAAATLADQADAAVAGADARALPFGRGAFDVALLTLTLHHFQDDDAVLVLRELLRVSRRGVLVGELERSWANYAGARLLAATLWRRNPLTRHDGPLSVLRAYSPGELLALALRAGLPNARVTRHPFQRLVLTAGPAA